MIISALPKQDIYNERSPDGKHRQTLPFTGNSKTDVRCASQIHSNAETHLFLLVPLKWKMNSLPWAIFLTLTGGEKIGKVALCLPCFNSRQSLTSLWFLEVKFKGNALLCLAGPIALKACLGQERCSHTESTSRSDMFRSWPQLRERAHWTQH